MKFVVTFFWLKIHVSHILEMKLVLEGLDAAKWSQANGILLVIAGIARKATTENSSQRTLASFPLFRHVFWTKGLFAPKIASFICISLSLKRILRMINKAQYLDSCRVIFKKLGLLTVPGLIIKEACLLVKEKLHCLNDSSHRERVYNAVLAVSNVLTAPIFSNSRNFEMEEDTPEKHGIKLLDP